MKLKNISTITATIELKTGLHIGAGDTEMHIGGIDNTVIKNPLTNKPYIPGSSLKGKIRSLLEWRSGAVQEAPLQYEDVNDNNEKYVLPILQLFGTSGSDQLSDAEAAKIGPTRLAFWDCPLNEEWTNALNEDNLLPTEVKSENSINRISGTAQNPRFSERVPAGAEFDFKLAVKNLDTDSGDLLDTVLAGLKLLEMDSLGGSGSRGYGKVAFKNIKIDGQDATEKFASIKPFELN